MYSRAVVAVFVTAWILAASVCQAVVIYPTPRILEETYPITYDIDDVIKFTNGFTKVLEDRESDEFVCNLALPNARTMRVVAGTSLGIDWRLPVEAKGDCSLYFSYSDTYSIPDAANKWFKIAQIEDCASFGQDASQYNLEIPHWLRQQSQVVLRWEFVDTSGLRK